ncbi:hypothetical protein SAMN04487912_102340 [Arthrobacter sp. cf158]|uniref:hypothetical protein n=1 Tax=Arthrobacter sp. cf158 TaxID=1761744 RepID=UPI00089B64E2|nr:hypothetical protein [Arthrobacter sp. cf158]SDW32734.1 hypothetical protein SAMN04487912_102340 [Arthrobacter sp. cf158]
MPVVTGNLTDVGGGHLVGKIPEIHFTLNAPNSRSGVMLPTEPVTVRPAGDGSWSADLQATTNMMDNAWYTVSIQWLDGAGNYVKADFPDWKLEVPTAGGVFSDLFGKPPTNTRMVYVSLTPPTNPRPFTLWLKQNPEDPLDPLNTGQISEWRNV